MFQVNQLRRIPHFLCMVIVILFFAVCCRGSKAYAMKVSYYPYKDIYNALPDKFQNTNYIYGDDIPYITFATYNGNNDYKTSVKKTSGKTDFLYCVDYSKHIVFQKTFSTKNKLFNNELRTRLGIAFYYGPKKWGEKANSKFTTGNSVLDYYMTQIVVHSLIYKYGDSKSNYGINYNLLKFKSNTATLKKKTAAFYKFCCDAKVTLPNGDFQSVEFSFNDPDSKQLIMDSNESVISSLVQCKTDIDSSTVSSFTRKISSKSIPSDYIILENENKNYNSAFRVKLSASAANQLEAGNHLITVSEQVNFKRQIAGFWKCSDSGFADTNQEVGGLISYNDTISTSVDFEFLIGEVILYKWDSITDEIITDALFQILQYDDSTGKFVYYKDLVYNPVKQCYESGNLYLGTGNKNGKFKIVEVKPGANYLNDWEGEEFTITKNQYSYEFNVENQPILGKFKLHKEGEQLEFSQNSFNRNSTVPLEGIKFSLFAEKDIYIKGKIFYKQNQKIVDLITDKNGDAVVNDLPEGDYYVQETSTGESYMLNSEIFHFSITRDNNRKYNEVTYSVKNDLKNCQIQLFKYYYAQQDEDQKNKIPLQGAKFGLYAKNDIVDVTGKCIIKQDSLIAEEYSDETGLITFDNLPYADYYLMELEAPKDFILNNDIITVSKNEFQYKEDDKKESTGSAKEENHDEPEINNKKVYYVYKEAINQKQLFKIKITKYGEDFSGIQKESSENGDYYSYLSGTSPLEKVQFSLYDDANHLIATAVTNSEGELYFSNIEPGKYYFVEDSCPEEYLKILEKTEIICESDDRNLSSSAAEDDEIEQPVIEKTVMNELCNFNLSICKLGEQANVIKKTISYDTIPLQNVVFGIYQGFDYKTSSGSILSKDSCVGYMITDKEGKAVYEGKLPAGTYYLKELKTNPGYDIDDCLYSFKVEPNQNQNQTILLENDNIFKNELSKASVEIKKTDANTNKSLKNVEFTLYNDNDQMIGVYKTDKKGKILVENLPYGSYYFIETKCKDGYYSTNNKYRFQLQSKEKITLNITNSPILKLGFEEHFKAGLIIIFAIILSVIAFLMFSQKGKRGLCCRRIKKGKRRI